MDNARIDGKICMVTGASSGIGRETARALASMGAHVVAVCRSRERAEAAFAGISRDNVEIMLADLSSQAAIRELVVDFCQKHDALHVLINNAGAMNISRSETADGLETTFATNHLAYFLLTNLLHDVITTSSPARIINISSRAHLRGRIEFDDLQATRGYGAMRAYSQSKLANVLFTFELARRLEGTGVTANCVHPGVVRTGFGKNSPGILGRAVASVMRAAGVFFISPERGAETSIYLASSPDIADVSGKYFVKSKEAPAGVAANDPDAARRLWEISEDLTGIRGSVASR